MILQFTSCGIHKDDLIFKIDNNSIKKFGSQGQQKSFLISLRFAEFEFLKNNNNLSPILLMDDIFDKLDIERVKNVVMNGAGVMPSYQGILTDEEIDAVSYYVSVSANN